MANVFYADESPSGQLVSALRGVCRITFAAKVAHGGDFAWITDLAKHISPGAELKSDAVIAHAATSKRARDGILSRLQDSSIVIVDLSHHLQALLRDVARTFNFPINSTSTVMDLLRSGTINREIAEKILQFARRQSIESTPIPRVERLLRMASNGLGLADGGGLFNTEYLQKLPEQEFQKLIARFTVCLGDALDPSVQADVITETMYSKSFFEDALAIGCLERVADSEIVFDKGSPGPLAALQQAHAKVVDVLTRHRVDNGGMRSSSVREEDSKRILGLQAADIAAGFARTIFEDGYDDSSRSARRVKQCFAKVMLNTEFLD